MRKDEEQAKGYFNQFLEARYDNGDIIWKDGDEPPDYWLTLSGVRYAVEVTRIMERADLGNSLTSHLTIWKSITNFVKIVEVEALKEGVLSGSYHIDFKPLRNLGNVKSEISKNIKEFVSNTKESEKTDSQILFDDGSGKWRTMKIGKENNHIYAGTTEAKWGEDTEGLVSIVNEAIELKVSKLRLIDFDKVLILLVAYPWIQTNTWESLVNTDLMTKFHTIFAINLMFKKAYSIIYSQYQPWNKIKDKL